MVCKFLYIICLLLIFQTCVSFQTFLAHFFHSMKCYYYAHITFIYMSWQSERITLLLRIKYYLQGGYCHFHENWIIMVCLGNHEDIQTTKIRCTFCSIYKKGHCLYIFRNYIQGMPHPAFCSSSQEIWVSEYLDCKQPKWWLSNSVNMRTDSTILMFLVSIYLTF